MEINKVHEDNRGSIYSITKSPLTYPEVSFLHTKAGVARGGCWHEYNKEHLTVIEGVIEYVWGEEENHKMMKPGDSITIPPKTPHYLISLTDSIVMEWGCTIEEKQTKHPKFRALVNEINENIK